MKRGKLIVFEGIDGSGKSTQVLLLNQRLTSSGVETHLFREPGGTVLGEKILSILLAKKEITGGMDPVTEFLLFALARRELIRKKLKPLLEQDCIVILDRFGDSSLAYQGYGRGVKLEFIHQVNNEVTDGIQPSRVFLLDIDPELAMKRIDGGDDRMEKGGIDFFRRVRDGYLEIARTQPEQYHIVDAAKDRDTIHREVWEIITKLGIV